MKFKAIVTVDVDLQRYVVFSPIVETPTVFLLELHVQLLRFLSKCSARPYQSILKNCVQHCLRQHLALNGISFFDTARHYGSSFAFGAKIFDVLFKICAKSQMPFTALAVFHRFERWFRVCRRVYFEQLFCFPNLEQTHDNFRLLAEAASLSGVE